MKEFIEELKYNQNINIEKDFENRIDIDYVIERLEDIQKEQNNNFENNVYDNGTMVLGSVYNVKDYICRNCDDLEEVKELIEDLENFDENVIVAVNYDSGMGYSIDYWGQECIVNNEEKEDNMNKEELMEKMYNYYKEGINNINNLIDLKKEIRDNLETLQGVEDELDGCRLDFGILRPSDSKYEELQEIWNELNNLKTEYERQGA